MKSKLTSDSSQSMNKANGGKTKDKRIQIWGPTSSTSLKEENEKSLISHIKK